MCLTAHCVCVTVLAVCVTVQLVSFNPIYAREHQGESTAEDPTRDVELEGGPLMAKMAIKPFGVSIIDGVTSVVKPLSEGEGGGVHPQGVR